MKHHSVGSFVCGGDLQRRAVSFDDACISCLSAALAVKRSFVKDDYNIRIRAGVVGSLAVCNERLYLSIAGIVSISDKISRVDILEGNIAVFPRLGTCILARSPRSSSALSIKSVIFIYVNAHTALLKQLLS